MSKRKRADSLGDPPEITNEGPREIIVAKEPDVVFILSNGAKTRVLVNSAVLRQATPVFRAMLGPNFKEGREIVAAGTRSNANTSELPTIDFPEDDATALMDVLNFLHNVIGDPSSFSGERIKNIALLSDKYDLQSSLKAISRLLLSVLPPPQPGPNDTVTAHLNLLELLWDNRSYADCACLSHFEEGVQYFENALAALMPQVTNRWDTIGKHVEQLKAVPYETGESECGCVDVKEKPGLSAGELRDAITGIEEKHSGGLCLYCIGGKEDHSKHA